MPKAILSLSLSERKKENWKMTIRIGEIFSIRQARANFIPFDEKRKVVIEHDPNSAISPSTWSPGYLSLLVCLLISIVVVLFYLYQIMSYVSLPADILMWAESNFVGDIIKIRTGVPLYTNPADSNSGIYSFAAPLFTYAISWVIGKSQSIVAWRMIQLGFAVCSALIATICCRRLYSLAYPNHRVAFSKTWSAMTFFAMFLFATAPKANSFAHCLHAEAMALLVSTLSFWTMLYYLKSPSWKRIILMAVCPASGFLIKQVLLGWAAVMFVFLLFRNPKDIKRLAFFVASAIAFFGIAIGLCYLLWGDNYIFWTFKVMGGARSGISLSTQAVNVSLPRSIDHIIRLWPEIAMGFLGGWLILRGRHSIRNLGPIWLGWILLIGIEAFSSGVAWNVLWHFGPGVFIGGIWLFSALPRFWPTAKRTTDSDFPVLLNWQRSVLGVVGILTLFTVMHVVPTGDKDEARYWKRRPSPDIYRYISDIEREFEGISPDKVLLDIGNWIYLRQSFLAKDRAISLADQPVGGIYENFEGMVRRIRSQTYEKILLHDFHSPFFLYDWEDWERSSGVKEALLENYDEVRMIPAAQGDNERPPIIMHTGPVSVLVPKPGSSH
jgi:hypothetical protein